MVMFSKKKQPEAPRRRTPRSDQERPAPADLEQRYNFRRNRTLTGSLSSSVSAPNELNTQLKSPRVQAHSLAQQRRYIGVILLLVLAASMVLFSLVWQFTAKVEVRTHDITRRLDPVYAETIEAYLGAHPVERLRFMVDIDEMTNYVQAVAPEVKSITSDGFAGFGASSYVMTMRTPVVGWNINGRQKYVDESGVSFSRNYFSSPPVQVVDNSGIQVEAGQAIAGNSFLSFVGQAAGIAKQNGLVVEEVIIPSGTTREVQLRLAGLSYPVKLSVYRPAGEQIEDAVRGIAWLQSHSLTPEYLDVRVSGRAFYR